MTGELGLICYRMALSAAERGDLSGAARLAGQALALDGGQQNARRLLGLCLFEMGELERAAELLAVFPDLSEDAREACESTKTGLVEVERFARRGRWRAALRAAERIPHQSARILCIRGSILAGARRRGKAARLFALAAEKDRGGKIAQGYLFSLVKGQRPFFF